VRGNLSLMLTISLALHVGLVATVALFFLHRAVTSPPVSSETATPTMTYLRSTETPPPSIARTVTIKQVSVIPLAVPALTPAAPQHIVEKALPAVTEPPALALEANPNAHVRALAPDAILSPGPAPKLNNADGVVFILDVSGSMYEPYAGSTRIAFARQALSQQIRALKDGTPFAITLYAQSACNSGPLVAANPATREAAVRFVMRDVDCGGGTNLPAGFASAQKLHPGALVLVTDGDLNISAFKLAAKTHDLLGAEGHGPALTVVGIAPRAEQGAEQLLESLADEQDGTYCAVQFAGTLELVTSAANVIKPTSASP
jgi:hypothetical protein